MEFSLPTTLTVRRGSLTLQRVLWAGAAVLSLVLLQSIYRQPIGWVPGIVAAALAVLAALRPYDALLVLAALGPLATVLFLAMRVEGGGFQYHEALGLATIAGWAARRAVLPHALAIPSTLRWATTVLLALVMASAVVNGSILLIENPNTPAPEIFRLMVVEHYLVSTSLLKAAMLLVEGLILMIIAAEICAGDRVRRQTLLLMMIVGASGAALLNVLRMATAAIAQDNPLQTFVTYIATQRVNVHYSDLNAAGSYFAMTLLIAIGLASHARAIAVPAAVLTAAALWLTGSRTAMAAVLLTTVVGGLLALRGRATARKIALSAAIAGLVVAAAGVSRVYPEGRNAAAEWSLITRTELAAAALKMAEKHPVFGVGVGRYYVLSNEYVGKMLATQRKVRENAHNYFLQVLAELGVPGLLLFLSVIGLALREAWRAASDGFDGAHGLFAGLVAFLFTCLAGHPLLVAAAAYPFWIALGLSAAPTADAPPAVDHRARVAGIALIAVIVATLPLRTAAAGRLARLEHVSAGFSRWHVQPDGFRYRWADGRSSFYVSSSAISVRIPLRHGGASGQPIEVVIFLDGREADRVLLPVGEEWRSVRVVPRKKDAPYLRIDLEARQAGELSAPVRQQSDTSGVILVGRPIIDF